MTEVRKGRGFFGYEHELEGEIFEFQRSEYPHRNPQRVESNWRWMFMASAARLGLQPLVWLYRKDHSVVAHQGAIPVRLHAGEEEIVTGWFVETRASRKVRGSPIGPMLIKKALEDMPRNLSLGQTELMRELQFAMGWKYVCSLKKYALVSGYRMNLRSKLPIVAAEFAALMLGIWHNLRLRWKSGTGDSRFRFGLLQRFTEEHDDLWRQMSTTCTCAVVRDASYMNWKYVDRPFGKFKCVQMWEGGRLAGVVVVMLADPNRVYNYRRGVLVDFLVPLDRPDRISAMIREAIKVLKLEGAETITCQVMGRAVGEVIESLGFVARGSRHQFLVAVGADKSAINKLLTEPGNWFLTLGDSDADAYPD